jgi:peptide/nickel transport system substrate-binding protein
LQSKKKTNYQGESGMECFRRGRVEAASSTLSLDARDLLSPLRFRPGPFCTKIRHRIGLSALIALALVCAACARKEVGESANFVKASTPIRGGSAVVLLDAAFAGSWPAGLDPATNPSAGGNISMMNAIYGGLFQLRSDEDGSNTRVEGVLATGYEIAQGGKDVTIRLREGVTFSDGTPFDAESVRFSMERAIESSCACSPRRWPWAASGRITTPNSHTVVLHFSQPYGPVINAFPASNINWTVSPTAFKALGQDKFKIMPVGAGPFKVVSNQLSTRLELERNSTWWQSDRPYLDKLIFQSIGGDQPAYQALLAGDAQAYEGMTSLQLLNLIESESELTLTRQPAVTPGVIQLNTKLAPFNNRKAREAIYFATDVQAIRKGIYQDKYPASQSFTAQGGLFHHEKVEQYRAYDPDKARELVREIGGLSVTLGTLKTPIAEQTLTALQTQWQAVGINVHIEPYDLATLIQKFMKGEWQAMIQSVGAYDPDAGSGLSRRFASESPYSGVRDPILDGLLLNAVSTTDHLERDRQYQVIARYISDNALAPFLIASAPAQVSKGLYGPGLTTPIPSLLINTTILWQDVWREAK